MKSFYAITEDLRNNWFNTDYPFHANKLQGWIGGMYKTNKKDKLFYMKEFSCPRQINTNLHKQASSDSVSAVETYLLNMKSSWSWWLVDYKGPNETANHWLNNVMKIQELFLLHFFHLYTMV